MLRDCWELMIRTARIERKLTVEELAERAGVSRGLVYRAEEGDMGCAIGAVFELATIVGVPLFYTGSGIDDVTYRERRENFIADATLGLSLQKVINDDF
ncbi:helix-turn-helix domain-containing protein [Klebsiella variicola subsp. variicola]|nr:helix-turn-helix domain-containing protein [Klebsiella variicola subsp. variicola]